VKHQRGCCLRGAGVAPRMAFRGTLDAMKLTSAIITSASVTVLVCANPCAAQLPQAVILRPPISPACVSSPFGPRVLSNQPQAGSYHNGIDLPAPAGAPILATAPGTVIRIQKKGRGGLEMVVQHESFVGIYSHFGMVMPAFAEGKRTVAAGEKLGVVGNTGLTTGAHLYFEMDFAGKPVDPAPYLGVPRCDGEGHRASNDRPDTEGKIIGGRKYYLIVPPGE
jgi:Peptidase family M23